MWAARDGSGDTGDAAIDPARRAVFAAGISKVRGGGRSGRDGDEGGGGALSRGRGSPG